MCKQGKGSDDTLSELSTCAPPSCSGSSASSGASSRISISSSQDGKMARVVEQLRSLKLQQAQGSTCNQKPLGQPDPSEKVCSAVQKMKAMRAQAEAPAHQKTNVKNAPAVAQQTSTHPVLPDYVLRSSSATCLTTATFWYHGYDLLGVGSSVVN